jgi:transposase
MTSHGYPFHTPLKYASIAVKNRIAVETRTTLSVTVHPRLNDLCHPAAPVYVPPPAISSRIRPSPTESQTLIAHILSAKFANTPAQVQRTISRRLAASIYHFANCHGQRIDM